MIRRGFGFFSLAFGVCFALSASGAFAAEDMTKGAAEAVSPPAQAGDGAVDSPTKSPTDAPVPVGDQTDAPLSADSVEPEIPSETPVEAEPLPSAPADAKILYFYPEPDAPIVPKPALAPAKAADAPKPVPAPQKSAPLPETRVAVPTEGKASAGKPAVSGKDTPATGEKAVTGEKAEKKAEEAQPGIWTAEPVAPAVQPAAEKPSPGPSRSVTVAPGQTLEVWYPGAGWVYLGDASAQNGVGYQTRKLDKGDTLFTFRALKEGNYVLEFSRYDVLANSFLADSLAVSVTGGTAKRLDPARAPDYRAATAAPGTDEVAAAGGSPAVSREADSAAPSGTLSGLPGRPGMAATVTGSAEPASLVDAAAILEKVKAALAANDPVSAQTLLDAFFAAAQEPLDEGLFLRGQAYEANGPARDMRKALAAYEALVSAYPESSRWKEADARIRYIRQFYLTIR